MIKYRRTLLLTLVTGLLLSACGSPEPVSPQRYAAVDALVDRVTANLAQLGLEPIADIDHSRLGRDAGSPMPPARVIIFSDPELEARLMALKPLVGVDLPLRILAYESGDDGSARVIFNSFDYLVARYGLDPSQSGALREEYDQVMQGAIEGLPQGALATFDSDTMDPDGIVTIASPYDFSETMARVEAAIDSQDDTVHFGQVDFQAAAEAQGIESLPASMILFGGPGPGGKAMAAAPTLGLDGFCQKFLVWQDADGTTYLSFNDLLALADRQGVKKSVALRVINFRLNKVFGDALTPQT